mmetsp:Transcript_847/g.1084  ORF Transcript_847/g.1084 Transcript_847/m.1084 type:complete len:122 (+) Transcript_847:1-366(+)
MNGSFGVLENNDFIVDSVNDDDDEGSGTWKLICQLRESMNGVGAGRSSGTTQTSKIIIQTDNDTEEGDIINDDVQAKKGKIKTSNNGNHNDGDGVDKDDVDNDDELISSSYKSNVVIEELG